MIKKIALVLLAILVIIQFIRPERNTSTEIAATDISKHFTVPEPVQAILNRSCNDCHSNNTDYPWYTNIQPVGWWLQNHVNDGKKELNFSEFGNYPAKRQHHKLEEVAEQVKEGHMPLNSYLWMHGDAKLNEADKKVLLDWSQSLGTEIAAANNLAAEEK
jgi:hypothetical protein